MSCPLWHCALSCTSDWSRLKFFVETSLLSHRSFDVQLYERANEVPPVMKPALAMQLSQRWKLKTNQLD